MNHQLLAVAAVLLVLGAGLTYLIGSGSLRRTHPNLHDQTDDLRQRVSALEQLAKEQDATIQALEHDAVWKTG